MIKDSGNRREFETGAVRDIAEGKGRCDLLPLFDIFNYLTKYHNGNFLPLGNIYGYMKTGDTEPLFDAINNFKGFENPETMILEVSKHFEEGCTKYGERNWEKGIPTHCYIDSAVRHFLKWLRGDTDERHDRAFVWNIMCCIWTCRHKPELNDYPIERQEDGCAL